MRRGRESEICDQIARPADLPRGWPRRAGVCRATVDQWLHVDPSRSSTWPPRPIRFECEESSRVRSGCHRGPRPPGPGAIVVAGELPDATGFRKPIVPEHLVSDQRHLCRTFFWARSWRAKQSVGFCWGPSEQRDRRLTGSGLHWCCASVGATHLRDGAHDRKHTDVAHRALQSLPDRKIKWCRTRRSRRSPIRGSSRSWKQWEVSRASPPTSPSGLPPSTLPTWKTSRVTTRHTSHRGC